MNSSYLTLVATVYKYFFLYLFIDFLQKNKVSNTTNVLLTTFDQKNYTTKFPSTKLSVISLSFISQHIQLIYTLLINLHEKQSFTS